MDALSIATKVSGDTQLKKTDYVTFFGGETGKHVLFLGNSITRHGRKEDIGWLWDHGMAATCPEKDYVHLLAAKLLEQTPACFCISQNGFWERNYKTGSDVLEFFADARAFMADVLIVKLGANCSRESFDEEIFYEQFGELIAYHNPIDKAAVIVVGEFYHHPTNPVMERWAADHGFPFVPLEDLCDRDDMKAVGLFRHDGVAGHPGDAGMAEIAARVWTHLQMAY